GHVAVEGVAVLPAGEGGVADVQVELEVDRLRLLGGGEVHRVGDTAPRLALAELARTGVHAARVGAAVVVAGLRLLDRAVDGAGGADGRGGRPPGSRPTRPLPPRPRARGCRSRGTGRPRSRSPAACSPRRRRRRRWRCKGCRTG